MTRPRWRRDHDTRWTLAATAFGAVALFAAILGLAAREVSSPFQPLIVLAAFTHVLLWATPFAVVLLGLARRRLGVVVAIGLLVLVAIVEVPSYISHDVPHGGSRISLLQANLRLGRANPASVVKIVVADHVDVLTTEELTHDERDQLVAAGLGATLPYRLDASRQGGAAGLAIWCRFPLSDEQYYPGFDLGVVSAQAHPPGGSSFAIFAVHLVAPYPGPASLWVAEMSRLRGVLAAAATAGGPVVVGGDFNATTHTPQFRELVKGSYRDGATQQGAGYLATYPADVWFPPIIGIDHVLLSRAQSAHIATVRVAGSDHRGLLATIRLDP